MRILFVAWRDLANELAGGSEVLIDRLATGVAERGHDVALMCADPVEPRAYAVQPNGGKIDQYARAPITYLRNFRDRDLLVDVANGMPFLAPLWRRGPSICFVNHIHTEQWGQWFPAPVAAFGREMERQVMPRVYRNHIFISVSPSTTQGLIGLGVKPDQVRTIINGTDLPDEPGVEGSEPLFVSLGRMVPHKRIDIMLRAWDRVRPVTGGRLVLIGDGPDRPRLEGLAGEGVTFAGKIPEKDKQELLSKAWMLVHTASHEGWGLVIMEAAAHGTPAIAFRVAGIRDSVAQGVSGELVDTEDEMVERWIELATDPERRRKLRSGARERAATFSWESTIEAFIDIAEEAIDQHRSSRRAWRRSTRAEDATKQLVSGPSAGRNRSLQLVGRQRPERPEHSYVIPAFNEELRLPVALPTLIEFLDGSNHELIIVDDGSSDETVKVATKLLSGVSRSQVLSLPRHTGKGQAVRAGVKAAVGQTITFMDADLATDLDDLAALHHALDEHHVAIGSRSAPGAVTNGWTPSQDAAHRSFNQLSRYTTGLGLGDFQCGFKAFRAPVAKLLFHLSEERGFAFDVELLTLADRIGYRVAELPVHWQSVRGSHTRIVIDSAVMAAQVARIGLRNRLGRRLASIEAWSLADDLGADRLTTELRRHLVAAPVVPWNHGALALLPFLDPHDSTTVAARLQEALPEVGFKAANLDPGRLFEPTAHRLRAALAAS